MHSFLHSLFMCDIYSICLWLFKITAMSFLNELLLFVSARFGLTIFHFRLDGFNRLYEQLRINRPIF